MPHKIQEVIEFGEQLLRTEDLDPVYVALYNAELPKKQLYRLLLVYFCFYHLGVAARISEEKGEAFWDVMGIAARNKLCDPSEIWSDVEFDNWPRGTERRHFRGKVCVGAVKNIKDFSENKSGPETFVGMLLEMSTMVDFKGFLKAVQVFPLFGPWIAFKVADVLERVARAEIEFPNDVVHLYKEPRAALDIIHGETPGTATSRLLNHFKEFSAAPPDYNRARRCNIQEVETILCKWKSSVGGHYWVGKDIHEIRKGLTGWGKTANKLLKVMPKEVEQGLFK